MPGARRRWRPGAACPASAAGWSGSARSCAVGGGLVGLAGDGLHAQRSDVIHQPALPAPAGGVQRGPVVGQEPLGHAVGAHALVEDPDGRVTGLGPGDQPGHRQAGVIVLKLEDHALAASLQDDSRWSRLPAGVRKRGRRTASRPLGASSWARRGPRPWPGRSGPGTPPKAPPDPWRPSCRTTLTGPWPRAREPLRGRAYCHRLVRGRLTQTSRTGPGATGPGLQHSRLPLGAGAGPQGVERLARDLLLGAQRGHRPTRSVIGPPGDGKANTGVNRLIPTHPPSTTEVSPPPPPELSPMS